MKAFLYDADGSDREVELSAATLKAMSKNCLLWIEMCERDPTQMKELAELLDLDEGSVDDLCEKDIHPHVDNYGSYYQVALLTSPGHDETSESRRLDMLVGPQWVVTIHEGPLEIFEQFRKQDKAETLIGALSAPALAASLLDWHLGAFFKVTTKVEDLVDRLDESVLARPSTQILLGRMVALRRQVSRVRIRLAAQRPAFYGLARPDFALVASSDAAAHYRALEQRFERALDEVERARDLVVGSFELLNSRISLQTNELVKLLTVLTAIVGLCGAVAGIFGMNFEGSWMKLGNMGFVITIAGMLLFAVSAMVAAKWAKWF